MSRVRAHDTKPERVVRSVLHSMGYRFRLHRSELPGTPDIVLAKFSTVILVHGCFWHRHAACPKATTPKTRTRFWAAKFQANKARDRRVRRKLIACGWSVITVWECQTVDRTRLAAILRKELGSLARRREGGRGDVGVAYGRHTAVGVKSAASQKRRSRIPNQ